MTTMPWDNPPQPQAAPAPQPQPVYTPPPNYTPQPPGAPPSMPAQQMRPDPPALKPPINIQAAIQQAVQAAITENKDQAIANAQKAAKKIVSGEKLEVESSFSGGPVTTKTFVQGMAVDLGFAAMATLAMVAQPDFNVLDKDAWVLIGVLMLKTIIQTGISYAMKQQVK